MDFVDSYILLRTCELHNLHLIHAEYEESLVVAYDNPETRTHQTIINFPYVHTINNNSKVASDCKGTLGMAVHS